MTRQGGVDVGLEVLGAERVHWGWSVPVDDSSAGRIRANRCSEWGFWQRGMSSGLCVLVQSLLAECLLCESEADVGMLDVVPVVRTTNQVLGPALTRRD